MVLYAILVVLMRYDYFGKLLYKSITKYYLNTYFIGPDWEYYIECRQF